MNVTLADRFLAISPSLAAVVVCGLAPELTKIARWRISSMLKGLDSSTTGGSGPVPPHLSESYIGDYVEYVVDIAQFLPGFLLPVITVLASLHFGLNVATAGVLLLLVLVALIFLLIRVLGTDPVTYVSRKYVHRYTLLSAVWLAMNAVAAIWVASVL